jgi:phage gp36-like protein
MATARTQEVNAAYVELENQRPRPKRSRARLVAQKTPKRHTSTTARGRIRVPLARRYTRGLFSLRTVFKDHCCSICPRRVCEEFTRN